MIRLWGVTIVFPEVMIMILYRVYIRLVLFVVLAASLMAWGSIGHMTVAYVAYQMLTPSTKARVRDLLKLNPDFANWEKQMPASISPDDHDRAIFMIAATWADDIKGEPQYSDDGPDAGGNVPDGASSSLNTGYSDLLRHRYWHFVDVPFSPDGATLPAIPTPNAETQIDAFRAVLASSQPDALKSYDLVWLLHLVGDVHQPLHATTRVTQADDRGDAGGNKVSLKGDADSNLHSYWDDLPGSDCRFCAKKIPCVERAVVLGQHLPLPLAKSARDTKTSVWIHESFEAARTVVYQSPIGAGEGPYTIVPSAEYETKAMALAHMRIALAGSRLAEVLNRELK
jgi:S1/P1 nuclease